VNETMCVEVVWDGQEMCIDVEAETIPAALREALDKFLDQFDGERHELFDVRLLVGDRYAVS